MDATKRSNGNARVNIVAIIEASIISWAEAAARGCSCLP
jgi:hypothetical protein